MMPRRVLLALTLVAASIATAACSDDEPATEPTGKDNANVEAGSQAVVKRKCVDCHTGTAGKLAGVTTSIAGQASGIELYPPNLTPDFETGLGDPNEPDLGKRGFNDAQLAAAIRTGYDRTNQKLCPQMDHFANMTDYEVYSIVKYLRSLPPMKNKVPRSVCPPLKTKAEQEANR